MRYIAHVSFLFLLSALLPASAADGIAFISNLKGEAAVDGNPRPLLLAELARGQRIAVGKDSQVSVMFIATGKEYILKGPADFVVKDTEVAGAAGIMPPAVRTTEWRTSNKVLGQVAQTSAASVRMRSIGAPRAEPAAKLLFPTEGHVATLQPTFRWRAADPKQQGQFTLLVPGQEAAVHQSKVTGTSYRVPVKLKPETEYAWTYAIGGDEVGMGRFRTLPADRQQQVESRRPSDKADFSDRLLFTLMLQEMGAVQEAQESWARLAQERADLPELSAFAK